MNGVLDTLVSEGRVIFGCGQLHKIARRRHRERLINEALDGGIREFDAAPAYGNGLAERLLGDVLRHTHRDVEVNTKVGIPVSIYPSSHVLAFSLFRAADVVSRKHRRAYARRDFSAQVIRRSLEQSLRRLRTDAVGTFFLHEPLEPFEPSEWAAVEAAMETVVREGKARRWGIAGRVTRYHRPDTSGMGWVPVMQLPMTEVTYDVSRPPRARQIGYSLYSAYLSEGAATDFETYLRTQATRHPSLGFVLATHDRRRLAHWTGLRKR